MMCFAPIDINANEKNIVDLYKSILFVKGTPSQHGRDTSKQYNIPISLNVVKPDKIKKTLYLIGAGNVENEILFSHIEEDQNRYNNYNVAVYKSKAGKGCRYNLISTINDRKLDDKFYKVTYIKDSTIKNKINNMVYSILGLRYGFELDRITKIICHDKPSETHQVFERGIDKIFFYRSTCLQWYGDGEEGKELILLFRKTEEGKIEVIWKSHFQQGWGWAGGSSYVTRYVGDLDDDKNIEVILFKQAGVSSKMYLVELENGKEKVIYQIRSDSEGEHETYPTKRNDKLLLSAQ
jgi:hypothetical protein